ncbi:hypothetical protein E8K88_16560 [Lampropedia aestuarii]|uniref:Uncharacterized protein n=1 Tax=Lampropedia aestuarii TaxID=2562762 RepID=A0A4S5BJH4_9BURK|nr:hypothetical protein [Lampropedia aestuarii]THJ30975.1 hypothetical protein E8K88_16560 [Lampropedia aestuarii]
MVGEQKTGRIDGVRIEAVVHEGLTATYNGEQVRLAIITADGKIIAAGKDVAREAQAVAVNCYQNMLKGQGRMRVLSPPLTQSK